MSDLLVKRKQKTVKANKQEVLSIKAAEQQLYPQNRSEKPEHSHAIIKIDAIEESPFERQQRHV